ncbi:MAG: GH25 family lysozyme [Terracidiphilus sp.]
MTTKSGPHRSCGCILNFLNALSAANGGSPTLAPGDLPPALDLEVTNGAAPADLIAGAAAWLATVAAATGKIPIVYTFVYFWRTTLGNPTDLSTYPLWIAELNAAQSIVPGGWSSWLFWQFAAQQLAGVPSATTDLDAFNGSLADLQALAG